MPAATCDGAESSCGAQDCAAFQTTPDGGEAICRVYGHKLLDGEEISELPPNAMWIPPAAVEQSETDFAFPWNFPGIGWSP